MLQNWLIGIAVGATMAVTAPVCRAQAPPSYGLDFVPVNAAGNAPVPRSMVPLLGDEFPNLGAVDHNFRIMRTEVTNTQWLAFVQAYQPYYTGPANDAQFTGIDIRPSVGPGGQVTYSIVAGREQWPAEVGWRYAARFCNWLTNGQAVTQSAFEAGAYDTSTFGGPPGGPYTDQLTHAPGAQFWIPTLDEWTAAMHYDPARYGPGQGGYWLYPTGSDVAPISGLPQDGGQTNAGSGVSPGLLGMPVASYVGVTSPWGALDGSGGVREWLEAGGSSWRYLRGSDFGGGTFADRADTLFASDPTFLGGVRIVSIPAPGVLTVVVVFGSLASPRRRRSCMLRRSLR